MSAAEPVALTRSPASGRLPQSYGTITVVGGGCYGTYYVRQLDRARRAGAIEWTRLVVVDRDPGCRVAAERGFGAQTPGFTVTVAEWAAYFDAFLASVAAPGDAIVPSPLMPHLLYEWLALRARRRWPDRPVKALPLAHRPPTPWERASPEGTHYVSFAEWTCPINCIEPATCPKTRGPRDWTMPEALRAYVAAASDRGEALAGPIIFHCTHRAYGVGMIDVGDVLAADALVAQLGTRGAVAVLIGTVSHCHGALNVLSVGA